MRWPWGCCLQVGGNPGNGLCSPPPRLDQPGQCWVSKSKLRVGSEAWGRWVGMEHRNRAISRLSWGWKQSKMSGDSTHLKSSPGVWSRILLWLIPTPWFFFLSQPAHSKLDVRNQKLWPLEEGREKKEEEGRWRWEKQQALAMFISTAEASSASGLKSSVALGLTLFTALVLWKSRAGEDPAGEQSTRVWVDRRYLFRQNSRPGNIRQMCVWKVGPDGRQDPESEHRAGVSGAR